MLASSREALCPKCHSVQDAIKHAAASWLQECLYDRYIIPDMLNI